MAYSALSEMKFHTERLLIAEQFRSDATRDRDMDEHYQALTAHSNMAITGLHTNAIAEMASDICEMPPCLVDLVVVGYLGLDLE
jgi:hypothetical protein